jgi:NhaP-type Na+/H+ or K+/H+ antiporter
VTDFFATPMLTLAVAMVAGVSAQALARKARLPGLVLLLLVGVVLGPDLLGILQPQALGGGLHAIVGFGVAVILFEGGLNQDIAKLRAAAAPIRMLVTLGALITAAGGALCAYFYLGWGWRLSMVFGTLVIVTGPTVITPLLRRIKVTHQLETVLEAEGIFIDAVGAIIAVTALEFALDPGIGSLGTGMLSLLVRVIVGSSLGFIAGLAMTRILRAKLVPNGLVNVFALSIVILTFEVSNALYAESGIPAAIACGMAVGHSRMRVLGQLMEFKEQLTVLVVAVLFVLLAADVRLWEVQNLDWGGALTVATLMLVVRPINVFVCTRRSEFTIRERLFLSWIAPRGIVAAAMASFFAHELARHGIAGGNEIRALVFLVIAATVTIQGLSGQWVANVLGVSRPEKEGVAIIGANGLALRVAQFLQRRGISSTLIDSNVQLASTASREGFVVVTGSALEERTLERAKIDSRTEVLCITPSEKVNFMVAQLIAQEHRGPDICLGLAEAPEVTPEMLSAAEVGIFSGQRQDLGSWVFRCRKGQVLEQSWKWHATAEQIAPKLTDLPLDVVMAVLVIKNEEITMADSKTEITDGTTIDVLIAGDQKETGHRWLTEHGFREVKDASE